MTRMHQIPVRMAACVTLVVVAVAAAACGGSSNAATTNSTMSPSAQRAHRTICNTAGRIHAEVQNLQKTQLKPANAGVLLANLQAIEANLQTIAKQARSLAGTERGAAMSAVNRFKNSLQSLESSFANTSSFSSAVPKIRAAMRKLQGVYNTAFDPLRC